VKLVSTAALVVACGLFAAPVLAQKQSRPDLRSFSFISGPKGDRPQVPGLNAVLLLTGEQAAKLDAARAETIGSEAVVSAGRKTKSDPNATDADRASARKLRDDAQAQFEHRVGEILSPAQKELVQRLQVLYTQAREASSAEYGPKLVNAKGNQAETTRLREEMRTALSADFTRRVNEILTPEQRAAFESAAAEEKRSEQNAKPKK